MNMLDHHLPRKWLMALVLAASGVTAWACFTPDRAAILALEHPDADFVNQAMHAHQPNRIPYFGPQQETPCVNGFADIFPCSNVTLLSHIDRGMIGGGSGSDSWGWVDPTSGIEYAIIGRSNGVAFVSLEDPINPVYLGNLPRPAGVNTSVWSDIKVYQNHAFMVADNVNNYGMQILDLSVLRNVTNPPVTFSATAVYDEFDSAHNIVINTDTGFAYAVGGNSCSGGLHIVDIKTPAQPVFANCFSSDGYTHDAQCVIYNGPDVEHQGKEICLASNEDTLTIVDVSDKNNLMQLSRTGYPDRGYTHQGWLTEDQSYFLIDDELDESGQNLTGTRTITMDVSDLDNPMLAGEHFADGAAIDHNQYIKGHYTYQANYRRGLRILRISDAASGTLTEEAFFDTYPEGDGNSFSGAWNVYPFFPSGNVLISDFNRGFFLVRPNIEIVHIDGFEDSVGR